MPPIFLIDFRYGELCQQYRLLEPCISLIRNGCNGDDDLLLEVIHCLATWCADSQVARALASPALLDCYASIVRQKMEDVDLVFSVVFLWFKMLLHDSSRLTLMQHQRLCAVENFFCRLLTFLCSSLAECVPLILHLVADPSAEIRLFSLACLDIISDTDDHWREQILTQRFETFNKEYIQNELNVGSIPTSIGSSGRNAPEPLGLHDDDDEFALGEPAGGYLLRPQMPHAEPFDHGYDHSYDTPAYDAPTYDSNQYDNATSRW